MVGGYYGQQRLHIAALLARILLELAQSKRVRHDEDRLLKNILNLRPGSLAGNDVKQSVLPASSRCP